MSASVSRAETARPDSPVNSLEVNIETVAECVSVYAIRTPAFCTPFSFSIRLFFFSTILGNFGDEQEGSRIGKNDVKERRFLNGWDTGSVVVAMRNFASFINKNQCRR